jgi:hypothetical protein
MLTELEILDAIRTRLKAAYPYPVYLEDSKEDFLSPCFFLKSMLTRTQERQDMSINNLTVYITFFALKGSKSAPLLYSIKDGVLGMFWQGFQVENRYLHVDSINADIDGSDADTAQFALRSTYYDAVPDHLDDYDRMGTLQIREIEK